jgi:hypothetical protein
MSDSDNDSVDYLSSRATILSTNPIKRKTVLTYSFSRILVDSASSREREEFPYIISGLIILDTSSVDTNEIYRIVRSHHSENCDVYCDYCNIRDKITVEYALEKNENMNIDVYTDDYDNEFVIAPQGYVIVNMQWAAQDYLLKILRAHVGGFLYFD